MVNYGTLGRSDEDNDNREYLRRLVDERPAFGRGYREPLVPRGFLLSELIFDVYAARYERSGQSAGYERTEFKGLPYGSSEGGSSGGGFGNVAPTAILSS